MRGLTYLGKSFEPCTSPCGLSPLLGGSHPSLNCRNELYAENYLSVIIGGERGMTLQQTQKPCFCKRLLTYLKDAKSDEPPNALRAAGVRIQLPFRYFLLI